MKLMSLFDGSGGFGLAGAMCGIIPTYASEIEPYPIAVTTSRFPNMKHLGSVTDIKGNEIEPVDVITFGSPCFPAGTLVLTESGYKNIEELKIGEKVFTHKGNWKPIVDIGYKMSPTVKVKGNHYGLITTPNHPFYSGFEEWTPAEKMTGKKCASPCVVSTENKLDVSAENAYQCGINVRVLMPHNVFLPAETYSASKDVRVAVLKGLLFDKFEDELQDEDFYFSKNKAMTFSVGLLAQTLGYSVRYERKDGYVIAYISKVKPNGDIHYWYDVETVVPHKSEEKVYNITVDEDHSYVVEGFVVHNCQDLSVAGKRAGLKHEDNGDDETTRSGLFMETIRIIKEMREATNGSYPKYVVWENVPGAFSSNKGEDFRTVLEEFIKINEPSAVMPPVPEKGWSYYDCFNGDGWSVAYRTFDAQFWGVPQRRRRIYLVADFADQRAGEILFKREGLRGYFAQGRTPWEKTSADVAGSTRTNDREGTAKCIDGYNGAIDGDKSSTLGVNCGLSISRNGLMISVGDAQEKERTVFAIDQQGGKGMANTAQDIMMTLCSDSHGTPHAVAYENGVGINGDKAATIDASYYKGCGMRQGIEREVVAFAQNQRDEVRDLGEKAGALRAEPGMKQQTFVAETLRTPDDGDNYSVVCVGESCTFEPGILKREGGHIYEGVAGTLRANAGDNQLSTAYGITVKGNGEAFVSKETHATLATGGGQPGQGFPCVVQKEQAVCGYDGYNQCLTGEISKTITSGRNDTHNIPCVVVDTPKNPIVCMATQQGGAEVRTDDKAPCLTASAGMSGNNQPVIAYSFDSLGSNSMKSSNPNSGCRSVEVAKCLDTTIPKPSKNQGGIAIVEQKVINLNKDDFQSKQVLDPKGIAPAIYAGESRGGGGECYIVDKVTEEQNDLCLIDSIGGQAENGANITSPTNQSNPQVGDPCHTLSTDNRNYVVCSYNIGDRYSVPSECVEKCSTLAARCGTGGNNVLAVVYCLQGNGIDRADTAGCNGKGWKEDASYTLNTIDRPAVVYAVDQGGGKSSVSVCNDVSPTLCTTHQGEPAVAYVANGGNIVGTLTASQGQKLWLGNQEAFSGEYHIVEEVPENKLETYQRTNGALCACDHKGISNEYVSDGKCIVESKTIEGDVIALDRASFNQGMNAKYDFEISDKGINSTLVAKGPSAVAYWDGTQVAGTLTKNNAGVNQRMPDKENFNCIIEDKGEKGKRECQHTATQAFGTEITEATGTLQSDAGHNLNSNNVVRTHYIVRRLTPTECARLQGFPDTWGHINLKEDFTDEEYKFWLEVRNTYAIINDKQVKDYTKQQMLTWYNKLHTDSAEYKMWGNGIALPNALYVMQGIADVMNSKK